MVNHYIVVTAPSLTLTTGLCVPFPPLRFQKVAPALASMSSRDSLGFGDLIPQDVVQVFAQERMSKSGRRKKRSKSLGRAFGWLKGKKRKDGDANGQSLGLGPGLYLALDGPPAGPLAGQKTGKQAGKQGHSPGVGRGKIPAPSPRLSSPPHTSITNERKNKSIAERGQDIVAGSGVGLAAERIPVYLTPAGVLQHTLTNPYPAPLLIVFPSLSREKTK